MRVFPLAIVFALTLLVKPAYSEAPDLFHEKIGIIASKFSSLNIPGLEKIQLPQIQPDGSFIFIYVWHPKTHRPTTASFEANIGDYFDIMGAQSKAFSGWCYLGKPETYVLKAEILRNLRRPHPGSRLSRSRPAGQMPGRLAGRGGAARAYAGHQGPAIGPSVHGAIRAPYALSSRGRAGSIEPFFPSNKSGRRCRVRACACSHRQRAMRAWLPDKRTSGISRPSHRRGFV